VHAARALPSALIWSALVALVAAFALAPPLLSADAFSYISYARLGSEHGLNPYDAVPAQVPADPAFAHLGWPTRVSAYGPLFTLVTYPLGPLGVPAALWVLKSTLAVAVLALVGLVARLAGLRGLDPRSAAAFVGFNPLLLVHVVGGAHNEGLMTLLLIGGIAAVLAALPALGGGALTASVAIKVSAAFALPFALLGPARRGRLLAGAAIAAALLAAVSLAAFGGHWLDSFELAGENQELTTYFSVPSTVARVLGADGDAVRIAALAVYGALVAGLIVWTARSGDWIRATGWAALGLLLTTGWLLPWYVLWLLPLAALSGDAALAAGVLVLTGWELGVRVPI
jgi:Glycosyltransferase family 87